LGSQVVLFGLTSKNTTSEEKYSEDLTYIKEDQDVSMKRGVYI